MMMPLALVPVYSEVRPLDVILQVVLVGVRVAALVAVVLLDLEVHPLDVPLQVQAEGSIHV